MSKLHTTLLAGVAVLALAFAATAFGGDVTQGDTSQSNGNGGTTNSGSNTSGQVSILGQTSSALSLTSVGLTGGAGGAGDNSSSNTAGNGGTATSVAGSTATGGDDQLDGDRWGFAVQPGNRERSVGPDRRWQRWFQRWVRGHLEWW